MHCFFKFFIIKPTVKIHNIILNEKLRGIVIDSWILIGNGGVNTTVGPEYSISQKIKTLNA